MKHNQVCVQIWVYFCLNYPDIREIIKWICERTHREWLQDHLYEKFDADYDHCTSYGAMTTFYCDIDSDLREALVEYALKVWAPTGMGTIYADNKELLGL